MTLRVFLIGIAMTGLALPATAAAPAGSVEGQWTTQDRDAIVELAPCGASLCGRIVKGCIGPFCKSPDLDAHGLTPPSLRGA